MVTVEVKDISKLAGIIRIPSMAEGAGPGDTTAQKILYSGLLNQCRKCRKFGHLAKVCPLNRSPTQSGSVRAKPHPEWQEKKEQRENPDTQRSNTDKVKRTESQQGKEGARPAKTIPNKAGVTKRNPNYPKNP
jgi:ribosome-binding protein aMBF1 (putative translation factor)